MGELDEGGAPKGMIGFVSVKEFSKNQRGEVVDGLESEKQNLVNYAEFNRKSMEQLLNRCHLTEGGGEELKIIHWAVFNQLQFMDGLVR